LKLHGIVSMEKKVVPVWEDVRRFQQVRGVLHERPVRSIRQFADAIAHNAFAILVDRLLPVLYLGPLQAIRFRRWRSPVLGKNNSSVTA
jgi:hypothetical protein